MGLNRTRPHIGREIVRYITILRMIRFEDFKLEKIYIGRGIGRYATVVRMVILRGRNA